MKNYIVAIIIITLSVAVGVAKVKADDTLPACRALGTQSYRLVNDTNQCRPNEEGVLLESDSAFMTMLNDDGTYTIWRNNSLVVGCDLYDPDTDSTVEGLRVLGDDLIECATTSAVPPPTLIWFYLTDSFITATCWDGSARVAPVRMLIRCKMK